MRIRTMLFRAVNRYLASCNLQIQKISCDFDGRLDDTAAIDRILVGIGAVADTWLSQQRLFEVKNSFTSSEALREFYWAYLKSPFRSKSGGSRFNNLAWLYLIARAMDPSVVIDSGTYTGGSAWAFSLAVPTASVWSFDLDLSRVVYRAKAVKYVERDWTTEDWKTTDLSNSLIYFDDHLDQARRLIEASIRGVSVGIFDDDFPLTSFAAMAYGGLALPKIEFLLDDDLRTRSEISWIDNGVRYKLEIDREYWDRARSLIADTERLPDTSAVTGILQTPYRIIRVRRSKDSSLC